MNIPRNENLVPRRFDARQLQVDRAWLLFRTAQPDRGCIRRRAFERNAHGLSRILKRGRSRRLCSQAGCQRQQQRLGEIHRFMVPDQIRPHHNRIMIELSNQLTKVVDGAAQEFAGWTDAETARRAKPDAWSKKEILGHLIDSASNNHQRFVRAALQDELTGPGYDQEGCVRLQRYQEIQWSDLLAFWASYN